MNCRVENVFITKPLILTPSSTVLPMPVIDGDYADLCTLAYSGLSADLQVTTPDGNLSLDGTDGTIAGSSVSSSLGFGNGFALVGSASSQSSILERTATVRVKLPGIPATYITDGDEFDDSLMPTLTYTGNIYFADPSVSDCYETLTTFQYQPRMPKEAANWAGLLAHKTRVVLNYPDATYATNGALKLALAGNKRIHTLRVPNMQNVNFDTLDLDINPNCIIYAGAGCSGKNVVVDGTATAFLLTDYNMGTNVEEARNYPFVVEEAFTATLARYSRKCYVDGGYETIILPFAPTRVYYLTESENYKGYKLQQFAQSATDEVVFNDATWQANTPYMIRPTASGTPNQQHEFRFIGENVRVEAVGASALFGTDFVGGYNLSEATGQYFLNSTGEYFVQSNKTKAWNTPFRCYLTSDSGLSQMRVRVEQPTDIRPGEVAASVIRGGKGSIECEATEAVVLRVTDLSGRLVREARTEAGRTSLTGFLPGFYLVNGQKVIVR
ncbi:MAG: hypothetical protein ACI36X_07800 [Bacteroidaceae bacterium]